MSYIGVPPFGQTVRTVTEITASAGQTTFTPSGGYRVGYVDVYLNGVLLNSADYTATDTANVVLASAAALNDEFKSVAYFPVELVTDDSNTTTKGLYEMENSIAINYVISTGNNAISAGPITVNSGISVTVPSGSVWTIV